MISACPRASVSQSLGTAAGRTRGSIDELPSGTLRVRVYAGQDPVSKRRHDLIEIISPGPVQIKRPAGSLTG